MTGTIARDTLTRYLKFRPRELEKDRRHGRKQGEDNKPNEDETHFSPAEAEMIAEANSSAVRYSMRLEREKNRIFAQIEMNEKQHEELNSTLEDGVKADRQAKIQTFDESIGPVSPLITKLQKEFDEKSREVNDIKRKIGRPLRVHIRRAYLPFLSFLALAELPINKPAFEFFFDEAPVIAAMVAFLVGVLVITLAHFGGIWLRQAGHYPNRRGKWASYAGVMIVFGMVGCLVYGIAVIRQRILGFLTQERQFDFDQLLSEEGLGGFALQTLQTELGPEGLTLLVLNVGIFCLGMTLAIFRHDPHPDYEKVANGKLRAERKLHRLERKYEGIRVKVERECDQQISDLERELVHLDQDVLNSKKTLEALEKQKKKDLDLVISIMNQRILAFQAGNAETRSTPNSKYYGERALAQLNQSLVLSDEWS
ncbi:MAG: hypothetical protein IIA72_13720 [Proteobacteria bacterium]|nr:hypothetical protein [Pseudomonadota bacterium]